MADESAAPADGATNGSAVVRDASRSIVAMIFGDSGLGKSHALLQAFPNAVCIAGPGGLIPGDAQLGFTPRVIEARNLAEATAIGCAVAEQGPAKGITALILDDVSILAFNTYADLRIKWPRGKGTGDNIFRLWEEMEDHLLNALNAVRYAGMHVGISAHTRPPKRDRMSGQFYKGGPEIPGNKLPRRVVHLCDLAVRVDAQPGRRPWPAVFHCEGPDDPQWHTKDRWGVLGPHCPEGPTNLGEHLRAAGVKLERRPGLEWQDKVADAVAELVVEGVLPSVAWANVRDRVAGRGLDPRHLSWALDDGLARGFYRNAHKRRFLDPFGAVTETAATTATASLT